MKTPTARRTPRWRLTPELGEPDFYLLHDTFATDLSAGNVDGTYAEPTGGIRTVVDGSSYVSIVSGELKVDNGAAQNDPYIVYPQMTRRAGTVFMANLRATSTAAKANMGWASTPSSVPVLRFNFTGSGRIDVYFVGGSAAISTYTSGTYPLATLTRSTGGMFFIKTSGEWLLYWVSYDSPAASVSPQFSVANATLGDWFLSEVKIPNTRWIPGPLASDGFGSTFGSTDGLGHLEGTTGDIGAGGDGVTWTGSTWTTSSGTATNTPTVGSELLTDGGLETWTGATDLTNWTEQIAGTSTVNQEASTIHGGTYAARFDVDASNNVAKIYQTITNSNGDWLLVTLWAKSGTAGRTIAVDENNGSNAARNLTLTTTYQQFTTLIKTTKANTDIGVKRSTGTSASLYIDDISAKVLTFSTLFASVSLSTPDVVATVNITRTAGTFSGIVVALDSASSPANFIIAYLDGNGNLAVDKMVSGTRSNVATTAVTYSAGAPLRVIKNATKVRVYYNNAWVGSELTISDAGIIDNTLHGLFSTDASNTFDDFVLYARGTNGEYAILDSF